MKMDNEPSQLIDYDATPPVRRKSIDYRVIFPNNSKLTSNNTTNHSCNTTRDIADNDNDESEEPTLPYLIAPHSDIARGVLMGNVNGSETTRRDVNHTLADERNRTTMHNHSHTHSHHQPQCQQHLQNRIQQPSKSNLSVLLENKHHQDSELPSTTMSPKVSTASAKTPTTMTESSCAACEQERHGTATAALSSSWTSKHNEADMACGPPPPSAPSFPPTVSLLGHSAPAVFTSAPATRRRYSAGPMVGTPPPCTCGPQQQYQQHQRRRVSSSDIKMGSMMTTSSESSSRVRRCLSSKELGTLAPPSGSPYAEMLNQKEVLESQMTERLREKRDNITIDSTPSTSPLPETAPIHNNSNRSIINTKYISDKDVSSTSSSSSQRSGTARRGKKPGANEVRQQRRAAHNRAVVEDLCDIVADLFIAESKLINPTNYGVSRSVVERDQVLKSVQKFVSALPTRYALGVDTPSEVLLHMRLMAVARSDPVKCVVHIINLDNDNYWTDNGIHGKTSSSQRLVTIACSDAVGLLEYITKLLGTGGSRVLDADVMLSSDRIVLDRFVVEMNGRLRLDKLAQLIESFLKKAKDKEIHDREHKEDCSCQEGSVENSGQVYYVPNNTSSCSNLLHRDVQQEIHAAVPLTEVLASPNNKIAASLDPNFETLKRHFSMPSELHARQQHTPMNQNLHTPNLNSSHHSQPMILLRENQNSSHMHSLNNSHHRTGDPCPTHGVHLQPRSDHHTCDAAINPTESDISAKDLNSGESMRQKRPLINRRGASDLDRVGMEGESIDVDYVTVPSMDAGGVPVEPRVVPLIPFDELMLIETIGMGRVSTIYRAAWQNPMGVQMVALKVAMVNSETGDMKHINEIRNEADIASRLQHPNVCDLVGVAADAECFCLAYEFCEGGSVLSLLSDTSRYYEYLPIALDVANGMAYLHSRNVIHRDLKPSNVLLTRDHRAKISDFGMSVANAGQELTAETGTYRYMAPEVIRHESYSSNADVYSFGIFLWQLITRQVPFASMTPVQAAYAVAEGRRPEIPDSTPRRLREIIEACWDQDSHRRPSFTYIAMALADYVKLSFSPASVGAQTLQIANDMLATVEGNSNINVDFTTPMLDYDADVGLEI